MGAVINFTLLLQPLGYTVFKGNVMNKQTISIVYIALMVCNMAEL